MEIEKNSERVSEERDKSIDQIRKILSKNFEENKIFDLFDLKKPKNE